MAGDRDRWLLVYADERTGLHPMFQKMQDSRAVLLSAVGIFAIGLTTSGYALGDGLRRSKMAEHRTVSVRGVSERDVTANLATWTVDFSHQGTDFASVQQSVDGQARAVRAFFSHEGFRPDEVSDSNVSVSRDQPRTKDGQPVGPLRLTVRRSIQLRTGNVMRLRAAYAAQSDLLREGVEVTSTNATYTFTGLNGLKPQMIAEATQNARRSADQFARDSGTSVGRIKTASQGYFSIGPRDGDECEGCNGNAGNSPFQKVRVVTSIDYELD